MANEGSAWTTVVPGSSVAWPMSRMQLAGAVAQDDLLGPTPWRSASAARSARPAPSG